MKFVSGMRFKHQGWGADQWIYEIRKLKGINKRPILVKVSYLNNFFVEVIPLRKHNKEFLEHECQLIYVPEKEEIKDKEYLELFI